MLASRVCHGACSRIAITTGAQNRRCAAAAPFQAYAGGFSFAEVASAEQLSQSLSSGGAPTELAFLGFGIDLGGYVRNGSGSTLTEDAGGNIWQQNWRGDDNLQFASQEGTGNRAVQQQYGAQNVSVLIQRGNGNIGEILQLSDKGIAALLQNGDRNLASVTQGSAGSFASISQSGVANIVAVRQ